VDATWCAHDGAEVKVTSRLSGVGDGTVTVDGREYGLDAGAVLAVRRAKGRTEVLQLARDFPGPDFEAEVSALLAESAEVRAFLGLDRPAPVVIRVTGTDDGPAGTAWSMEIENVSDRPVREVRYRVFRGDTGGSAGSVSFPPEAPLAAGATSRQTIPRPENAESATVLVTEALLDGEPARWAPAGN
jgi:hypothetical protein